MQIETTISIEKDGYCIIEQDVTAHVDVTIHEYEEWTWKVSHYTMQGCKLIPGVGPEFKAVEVPDKLAEVFNEHLDRAHIEAIIADRLGEYSDEPRRLRADYLARVL